MFEALPGGGSVELAPVEDKPFSTLEIKDGNLSTTRVRLSLQAAQRLQNALAEEIIRLMRATPKKMSVSFADNDEDAWLKGSGDQDLLLSPGVRLEYEDETFDIEVSRVVPRALAWGPLPSWVSGFEADDEDGISFTAPRGVSALHLRSLGE